MRSFLSLFVAATAAVSTVSGFILSPRQANPYPACAQSCLASANLGSCGSGQVQCLCNDQAFVVSTTQCFDLACNGTDLATAVSVAQQVCAAAGVTLTSSVPFPTSTSPGASSKATTPTSSASPAASTSAKPNSAASNAINIMGGAAALGLAALML